MYNALQCSTSDSRLAFSFAEFPKYFAASFDLGMQRLKYLHLTKRPE